MSERLPRTRAEWIAWAKAAEEKSPARFRFAVLTLAAVLMLAHYATDELAYHPEHSLWTARAFWSSAWVFAVVPFVMWLVWRLLSAGQVKPLKPILVMSVVLCAGSALAFCVPFMLRSIESLHLVRFDPSVEKWHWSTFRFYWQYWTPAVLILGNLILIRRWKSRTGVPPVSIEALSKLRSSRGDEAQTSRVSGNTELPHVGTSGLRRRSIFSRWKEQLRKQFFAGDSQAEHQRAEPGTAAVSRQCSAASRGSVLLKALAITSATAACGLTALHLGLPRVPANADVVDLARIFLVQAHLKSDFDFLLQHSFAAGRPLAPLLAHLELADLQRHQFYPSLDDATFQAYMLSPEIARLPLDEVNWRRALWEHFYPRIRRETDPTEAAKIVVRSLRERVGLDPSYRYRVGVETIWTQQMTDEAGFERIYVAALRSVGIAARLNDRGQAELLNGQRWQAAPRTVVASFEDNEFPVPRGGLVNFRN